MNWEGMKGIGGERERHTKRHMERQTNTQKDSEANRDTQRQQTETESNVKPELRQ